jgi:hypothetical protein
MKRMRKTRSEEPVRAHSFEPNAFYERVLELRRDRPAAFDSLAPVTKLALGGETTTRAQHLAPAA